jgi:O-antigen/teichoic acid export membrane protein
LSAPRLTQKDVALFFFPLLLNVQLMSVSHSVINAGLARLEDAVTILAGFSVAMVLHLFVASPSYQNHTITIAMVRGRKSLISTTIFILLLATWVSILLALLAFSPVGTFVLDRLLGVSPEVAQGAREALALLVFLPFITGLRGLFQGLVIRARRTGLVSFATAVRIAMLFAYLWLGQLWFSGTRVAAFALLGCVGTETLMIAYFAWRVKLPAVADDAKSFLEILRYGLPLAYSSGLQQTVPLLINAIISRLPDGTLALAAFGVIRGFLFLLAGPMRNLQQAYLTLVRRDADHTTLISFFIRVSIGMAVVMLILAWPLNQTALGTIMGLDADLRSYITWPLTACALFPFLYGAANLLRGWFAGAHLTGRLGLSTLYKALLILMLWPLITLTSLPFPGIAIAIFLLLAAELCEAGYLYRQRSRLLEGRGLVPLDNDSVHCRNERS